MLNINDYLKKFRTLTSREGEVKCAVQDVVFDQCRVKLSKDKIRYSNKTIFISTHPLIKNEIFIKKKAIIDRLREKSSILVTDIH